MRTKIVTIAATLIALLALLWAVTSVMAQPPAQGPDGDEPGASVPTWIHVQGRLYFHGNPVADGSHTVRFRLYTAADTAESDYVWTATQTVTTTNSLFSTYLNVDQGDFDGQALWLGVKVALDSEMTPRRPLLPVPYALGLAPGALISDTMNLAPVLRTFNSGSAAALTGRSTGGNGIYGQSDVENPDKAAVYGYASEHAAGVRAESVFGYGVYAESQENAGVYGSALDVDPGVYGRSVYGHGVQGLANNTGAGVYGESDHGTGVYGIGLDVEPGVYGESTHGHGVYGLSGDGTGDAGLYGKAAYTGTAAVYAEGPIQSSTKSYIWISGCALQPDQWGAQVTAIGGRAKVVLPFSATFSPSMPIAIPGVLYGQNVTVESVRIYYQVIDGDVLLQASTLSKWSYSTGTALLMAIDTYGYDSTTPDYFDMIVTQNGTLSADDGILSLEIVMHNDGEVDIHGVRLEISHE